MGADNIAYSDDRLAATLFGKTRRAVLALTYGQPEELFYLRRISRFVGTGMGVVQRELKNLVDAGILRRTVSGRQVYYQADKNCLVYHELRGLVVKTFGLADVVREALVSLADRIAVAFIFGSFACGTQTRSSDIDLLVVGDVSFGEVADVLARAQERVQREINPSVYPPREFYEKVRARHHFLTHVLNEPKVFLLGEERELKRLAQERLAD